MSEEKIIRTAWEKWCASGKAFGFHPDNVLHLPESRMEIVTRVPYSNGSARVEHIEVRAEWGMFEGRRCSRGVGSLRGAEVILWGPGAVS